MRWTATKVFPLALMFALALLTFYLERAVRDEDAHPAPMRHDPDYIVGDFTTTTYDAVGRTESVLSAEKMIHYPDDDSTELVHPRLEQTRPGEPRTTVRAQRGALARQGEEVFLYDDVVLVRDALEERPRARMTTSFLHVVRDRSLARTDRPVRLEEEHRTLIGRGMEYDYDAGRLVLHADVHGRFEPKNGR